MTFSTADRLKKLPPYLFAKIDALKEEEAKKGRTLLSLSVGDPDLPTPEPILSAMQAAIQKPENHQYPSYWGLKTFRQAVADWYLDRFNVSVHPHNEVLSLIGSKEGIAHIPLAFINPGDGVLVPNPGYPVYEAATHLAGGVPLRFPLLKENHFLPNFSDLEQLVLSGPKVKLMFLNYPNNPTSACAPDGFFEDVVRFAKKHSIIVCHDNAYSEIYFDGKIQKSFLQTPGAKDVGVEFHSLSKTFNMTGWRVGFVVGHKDVVAGLAQVKTNIDSGIFNAVQEAGIAALKHYKNLTPPIRAVYQKRRDILLPALKTTPLNLYPLDATFYVWAEIPKPYTSEQYVIKLVQKLGVICTPGNGFGTSGEGFVRFTLCQDISKLKQVAESLKTLI